MKKVIVILIIVILLVLASSIFGLIYSGWLSVIIKNPDQTVVLKTSICSNEVIEKYNKVSQATSREAYEEALGSAASEVEVLAEHETDPNCTFILYKYYVYEGNTSRARYYADLLRDFSDSGNYLSGEIASPSGIQTIERDVELLEQGGTSVDGAG